MPIVEARMSTLPDQIASAYSLVSGCYVSDRLEDVKIQLGAIRLVVSQEDRSDLHKLYPGRVCQGFHSVIEAAEYKPAALRLRVTVGDQVIDERTLDVTAAASIGVVRSRAARNKNRSFVLSHLICSQCGYPLRSERAALECPACRTRFVQGIRAVSAVAEGSYVVPRTINTSLCGYDVSERQLIESIAAHNGRVLDFGAGLRPETNETVIALEIADMPSTDIVSISDRIPFADNTFDAAMSLHVLEHVSHPWIIAQELQRVVKPGGTILSTVPYVCPVHGFPHHYFSMTPQGLRSLFADAEFVSHTMKGDAHPINGLRQLLSTYAGSLDHAVRGQFESLTIGELLSEDLGTALTRPWADKLSELARWEMPAHSTLTVRKR